MRVTDEMVTLADCPIGLFLNRYGGLCLKTEYGNNEGRIDAFIVSSGEFFWGDAPQTIASQRAQMVRPVEVDEAALAAMPQVEGLEATALVRRLRAPAYWMSGSSEGHEGENDAHREAADLIDRLAARLAAAEAEAARLRKALDEIVNPLQYLQKRAEKDGSRLSSMAWDIVNSVPHLQGIARAALSPKEGCEG